MGKWIAGILSNSIAITGDAFNNLSDAGSSIITLIGFRISGQKPDPEHPFGHGRMEYISGLLVSVAILIMGFELAKSSVEKILHPEAVDSSPLVLGILAASIVVKIYMFYYNRSISRKIDSAAMKATAMDSLKRHGFHRAGPGRHIDRPVYRPHSGRLVRRTCGNLYPVYRRLHSEGNHGPSSGSAAQEGIYQRDPGDVVSHPLIYDIHDLIVHDYGPGRLMISLHAEVDAEGDIQAIMNRSTISNMSFRKSSTVPPPSTWIPSSPTTRKFWK